VVRSNGYSNPSESRAAPLLEVRDLRTQFRVRDTTVYAVEGASFSLHQGETVGIVGESGSGKSVSALSIMGMIRWPGRVVGGEVLFHGEDLLKKPESQMRRLRGRTLAMIPQNPLTSLNPVLTVGDHLREILWVHLGTGASEATRRGIELLRRVGLPDPAQRMNEYPHRMSGGQRQRVMIALAMACGPELLIADEPTTALDVTIQAQILDLMDELARESNLASILISHNLGIIAAHCDRVVVMYAGRVVESATVADIFADPRHPYTVGLLNCVPRLTAHRADTFQTIPGSPPVVTEIPTGCPFAPRCGYASEVCWEQIPELTLMGPDHRAACWNPVQRSVELDTSREAAARLGAGSRTTAKYNLKRPVTEEKDSAASAAMLAASSEIKSAEPTSAIAYCQSPATHLQPLIEVNGLKVHYTVPGEGWLIQSRKVLRAVDGVSFQIREGETLGLVGESGCGKSTIGRTMLFLERPIEGQVKFQGRDLGALAADELRALRRHMQIVFQDPFASLNPRMTIGQIIGEPLSVHHLHEGKTRRDRIADLLSMVELSPDFVQRYPHEFSGGQRQRIGIARALAVEPSFIVLDEPVSALDVSIQAQILRLLSDLQKRLHLSYLFIAHDLAVVGQMSDRVAVMYLGKIVELAERDALYQRPHHPYTQALFSAVPVPDPQEARQSKRLVLAGEVPSPINLPSGCRFHSRCPLARDVCSHEEPPLRPVGSDHEVACHFAEEAAQRFEPFLKEKRRI